MSDDGCVEPDIRSKCTESFWDVCNKNEVFF